MVEEELLVTLASISDVRVAIVALGAVARKASVVDLLSAVAVVALAKSADHISWALG
jgi:hypothetical protein